MSAAKMQFFDCSQIERVSIVWHTSVPPHVALHIVYQPLYVQSKMVSKQQANPSCAEGISVLELSLLTIPMGDCTALVKV